MKRFLNLELKIDQRKLHSDQTGRFRGLVFNECHRRQGGNPQNAHRSGSRQRQYRCRADNDRQRPELKLPETTNAFFIVKFPSISHLNVASMSVALTFVSSTKKPAARAYFSSGLLSSDFFLMLGFCLRTKIPATATTVPITVPARTS